jgi:hypothetical protein
MADFATQIDDTQKVLATCTLTKSNGEAVAVTGLTLTQTSGDASFSMVGNDGNALPVEQVFLVSGATDGISTWDVAIANDFQPATAQLILTVIAGAMSVSFLFGTPEPK